MRVAKRVGLKYVLAGLLGIIAAIAPASAKVTPLEAAQDEQAIKLAPYSPWNIDFGESRCRLQRLFGSKDDPHVVFFEQSAPRSTFAMTLAGSELKPFMKGRRIEIGLLDNMPMRKRDRYGRGEVGAFGPAIILTSATIQRAPEDAEDRLVSAGIDPKQAAKVQRIVLKRGKKAVSYETGSMTAPFEALNTCTRSMLELWGLDPDKHAQYQQPRLLNFNSVARKIQTDYPDAALGSRESGSLRMRVIVESDGSVAQCALENLTVTEKLKSPACQIVERVAEFEPARDADGAPMKSFYAVNITYAINN